MTPRTEVLVVEKSELSMRLDAWLRTRFPAVSRGAIQRLIEEGHIRVDGNTVKPTHTPRAGQSISVFWPEARPIEAKPEDIPLEILFEDESLVVINKPPGLVVHPAAGHDEHTLVNALLHHCAGQLSGIGGAARPGIVHRLDKDTSGCLVVAKTDAAHLGLSTQFAGREVNKIYQAILCGELPREAGEIHAAIARHPTHRKRMAVTDGDGRDAHTSYQVVERLRASTLVQAVIHTGRTHQIRVHFQHLGYPLLGDDTYGNRQNIRLREVTGYTAERQMLHAFQLSFQHPVLGKKMKFDAPLPPDFTAALDALRGSRTTARRTA
ncbi:MAG: RluA family pseudouridine synthase [Verrucomicrobia bacterium]|nr:RluA family pseudouridine synthase [Verrucomicrobiota bacterium]